MMNDGRWPDSTHSRAVLLRALAAHARGVGDAPMVCKWGTLADAVVRQAHHERDGARHEWDGAHPGRNGARGRRDGAHPEREYQDHPHPNPLPSRARGIDAEFSGALTFVASTGAVDRHGDTVAPEGWRLDAYRENPVVLWAHDYRRPAIGRTQSVWRDGGALLARLEFADTEFAREVEGLYRQGYQQGVSVGFRPLRFEERRDARTGAFLGIRFLEQELLEISAVPVPANRGALMTGRMGSVDQVVGLLRGMRP